MANQRAPGVPAEMAEIYDDFYDTIAFRFNNNHAETSLRQNVGYENEGTELAMVDVNPSGLVDFLTNTPDSSSLALGTGIRDKGDRSIPTTRPIDQTIRK